MTTPAHSPAAARRPLLRLLPIVVVAAALRLAALDRQPFWTDEGKSLHRASLAPAALVADLASSTHPPLYFLLLHAWTELAGATPHALRLFSALAGIAAVPAAYGVGAAWAGAGVGLGAALVTALSPIHVYYSQEARSYALVVLLGFVQTYWFLRLREADGRRRLVPWLAATLAGVYVHYWFWFLVAAENLCWLAAARPHARAWLAAQAVLVLAYVPWAPELWIQMHGGGGDWIPPPTATSILKSLYRFSAGYGADVVHPLYRALVLPFVAGLHLPLLAVGIGAADVEERPWRWTLAALLFLTLALALAVSWVLQGGYLPGRFDMVVYPCFALLAGRGVARLGGALRAAALAGLVASSGLYLAFYWLASPIK